MLSVPEALSAIVKSVQPFVPSWVPLNEALGLVLAEEVVSDIDSPPFDKSLMDGFAVRSDDLQDGQGSLRVIEEVMAGAVPTQPIAKGESTQIMTGALLPEGADSVVRVEDAQLDSESGTVRINSTKPISPGTNIIRQGTSTRRGEPIVPAGRRLRPQELGAMAELGGHRVSVRHRPRVGILATGDELVPIDEKPGPGKIRNSNETMLAGQIRRAGAEPVPLGIARDERAHLQEKIQKGLTCDLLLLSGGVSAGKRDLVPSELEAAGVRQIFHKVRVKPGKPLWFGIREGASAEETGQCWIFGLPGNPVSSMVCFELFVRTAIRRSMGVDRAEPVPVRMRLSAEYASRGDRPVYYPARWEWTNSGPEVALVRWHGSSDLRATVEANGMVHFPAGEAVYRPGDEVDVFLWDGED